MAIYRVIDSTRGRSKNGSLLLKDWYCFVEAINEEEAIKVATANKLMPRQPVFALIQAESKLIWAVQYVSYISDNMYWAAAAIEKALEFENYYTASYSMRYFEHPSAKSMYAR